MTKILLLCAGMWFAGSMDLNHPFETAHRQITILNSRLQQIDSGIQQIEQHIAQGRDALRGSR